MSELAVSIPWNRVRCLPVELIRVWIQRRWPESQARLELVELGRLKVSGPAADVGRIEMMLEQIEERGYPG